MKQPSSATRTAVPQQCTLFSSHSQQGINHVHCTLYTCTAMQYSCTALQQLCTVAANHRNQRHALLDRSIEATYSHAATLLGNAAVMDSFVAAMYRYPAAMHSHADSMLGNVAVCIVQLCSSHAHTYIQQPCKSMQLLRGAMQQSYTVQDSFVAAMQRYPGAKYRYPGAM
jgi:hypothetical protein